MLKQGTTIREAAEAWVHEMDAIPYAILDKLIRHVGVEEVEEVTPPSKYDQVYVFNLPEDYDGDETEGTIIRYKEDDDTYIVQLDDGTELDLESTDFEIHNRDDYLPMWGTLWSFSDMDQDWAENNLQAVADCGFRIYYQEDYGYIIGVDGCGYDFYERHWIPLYKARGLHWHDEDAGNKSAQAVVKRPAEQSL